MRWSWIWLVVMACGGDDELCAPVGDNLIGDGTFEQGLDCWTADGEGITVMTEGTGAPWILIPGGEAGTPQQSIRLVSSRFAMENDARMAISFRAKASVQRNLWLHIESVDPVLIGYEHRLTLDPGWQDVNLVFASNAVAPNLALEFRVGEAVGDVEIDDVVLVNEP
ncbi:MAG: hypothetical protein AB8H79_10715 [Myxococcota bacterium]